MALSTLNSGAEHAREKIVRELQGTRFDISGFIFRFSLLFGLGSGVLILGAVMWDVVADGSGFLLTEDGNS